MASNNYLDKTGLAYFWAKVKAAFAPKDRGIEYIRGTWTAASGTWTGVSKDSELYDGKQIILYMPFAGSGNATLNLTLADGTKTGAKNVYYESTNRFTTHKGQNSQLHLIYHNALTLSNGTTYEGWWYVANRDTTDIYKLATTYSSWKAKAAIYRYMLLLTYDDEYLLPISNGNNNTGTNKTYTTEEFDPFGQIWYWSSTSTVSANAKMADGATCSEHYANGLIDFRYATNMGKTLIANKAIYLVCVPQSDGKVRLHTTPIAQALPTTEDGLIYKYIGRAYDTYRMWLDAHKPCYWYRNGKIRLYTGENRLDSVFSTDINGRLVYTYDSDNPSAEDITIDSNGRMVYTYTE